MAMRPKIAVRVLSAPRTPVFSGLPSRIRWTKADTESIVIFRGDFSDRLLLRTTKMAPMVFRSFDHPARTEKLLDDIPVSVGSKGSARQLALNAIPIFKRDKVVIAHIALFRRCRPSGANRA